MNEQEMQFADPDWKPTGQTSVQSEAQVGGTSIPQPVNSNFYDANQSASTSSYAQGYRSRPRDEQVPYISPVVQQRPVGATRRRSHWWVWLIVGIVFFSMIGNFTSHSPGDGNGPFEGRPFQGPMQQTSSYALGDTSLIRIDDPFGTVHVQVNGDANPGEVVVSSDNPNGKGVQFVDNKGVLLINSGGDMIVTLPQGQVALDLTTTSNNDIEVDGYAGQLTAKTDGGLITLNNDALTDGSTISSSSGNIEFSGTLDPQGKYQFATDSGNIDLTLPADTPMQVHASTGPSGSYNNEFSDTTGTLPRASIDLQTKSGEMTIHKQN